MNNVRKLVTPTDNRKVTQIRQIFKVEVVVENFITRFKPSLLGISFVQVGGVRHTDGSSTVKRYSSIKTITVLVFMNGWKRMSLNFETVFLSSSLESKLKVVQAEGFERPRKGELVYLLLKILYALKQASRLRQRRFYRHSFIFEFFNTFVDPSLYIETDCETFVSMVY